MFLLVCTGSLLLCTDFSLVVAIRAFSCGAQALSAWASVIAAGRPIGSVAPGHLGSFRTRDQTCILCTGPPGKFLFLKFLLEYSWFIILCWFLLYSKVSQLLYTYNIYPPCFIFFSHIGHDRALSRVSCTIQ